MENTTTAPAPEQSAPTNDVTADSSTAAQTSDDAFVNSFFNEGEDHAEADKTPQTKEEPEANKEDSGDKNETQEDQGEEKQEKQYKGAEARKQELTEQIRGLVGDVRKLEQQKQELTRQVAQSQEFADLQRSINQNRVTPQDLMAAGLDAEDAYQQAIIANQAAEQQQRELDAIQREVADLQHNLYVDQLELVRDYPVFDEQAPEFDEAFTRQAMEMWEQAAQLRLDDQGMPVSARVPLYDYMAKLAEMRNGAIELGNKKGRADHAKQQAGAFVSGGAKAPSSNKDATDSFVKNFFKK